MDLHTVIIRPIITEKSMANASMGIYTFAVKKAFNKAQIRKAIEDQFKVKIVDIKTINTKGKTRLTGRLRRKNKVSGFKKAIVKLLKDQKIDIFESFK